VMHLRNTALLVMNECRLVNILNHDKQVSHLFAFCKTFWSLINKFFWAYKGSFVLSKFVTCSTLPFCAR
jgi:hypothetical protein